MGRPGLSNHRKFKRLARALEPVLPGCGELLARGALETLWDASYENGEDYIGEAVDVEALAGWRGPSGVLCAALMGAGGEGHAGFIEAADQAGHYRIHDLYDHAPDYVQGRQQREQERRKAKTCGGCGGVYHSADHRSQFCGGRCRTAAWRARVTDCDAQVRHRDGRVTDCDVTVTDCDGTPAPAPAPILEATTLRPPPAVAPSAVESPGEGGRTATAKGLALVPAVLPAREEKRAKTKKPTDPRHAPLVAALVEAFMAARGTKYGFRGQDARAVKELLTLGTDGEILERWRRGLGIRTFPGLATLTELLQRWNHIAGTGPPRNAALGMAPMSTPEEHAKGEVPF